MRIFYLVLLPLSLTGLVTLYFSSGTFAATLGVALWFFGFIQHKHRAYARSLKARAVGEYESALDRWFGA